MTFFYASRLSCLHMNQFSFISDDWTLFSGYLGFEASSTRNFIQEPSCTWSWLRKCYSCCFIREARCWPPSFLLHWSTERFSRWKWPIFSSAKMVSLPYQGQSKDGFRIKIKFVRCEWNFRGQESSSWRAFLADILQGKIEACNYEAYSSLSTAANASFYGFPWS